MLREEATKVLESSVRKNGVIRDPDLYFVLTFVTNFRSATLRRFLKEAGLVPVSTIGDNAAKLRISKAKYEHFLRILQKYSGYVKTIREASFEDKVEKRLLDKLSEGPTEKLRVNIEIPNLEDHSYATRIYQELETYMHARNLGDLEQTYLSDHFIIITAQVPAEAIQEIARNVDAIHRVSLASIIKLQGYGISREVNKKRTGMRLESLSVAPQFASINISAMPIVCVLDSGINRNHTFIQPYIVDTYDFMSGASLPCDDNVGHGTMVAGVAVYEGNVGTGQPISRVIAVKICDSMEFSGNIIELIRSAIRKFGNQSKVINLSFSTDYPDPALSKELDDLAFKEGVLFVVCTGNIQRSDMLSELNNGNTYPSYLSKYHIFFPGDCFNVLTVGSFAARASNLALDGHPSPFTRTNPFVTRIKPEVLASGGNMNVIQMNGKATDLTSSGCGVTSTTNSDNQLGEAAGTSFASPTTAGLVASVNDKWAGRPPCFYKAMVISSCRRLTDRGNQEFAASIQGFGVPTRENALSSLYWRINLFASAELDPSNPDQFHRFRFLVPDNADRVRITLCYDVEPLFDSDLPYEVTVKLHKPGSRFSTPSSPNVVIPDSSSNVKQLEYEIKRAGRGFWTLDLLSKSKPAFQLGRFVGRRLRYGLIITIYSTKRLSVYGKVAAAVRPSAAKD